MDEKERALREFRRLAEAWGGDIDRWPAASRDWARAWSEDAEAAAILAAARRLDMRLAAHPPVSEARAAAAIGAVMGRLAEARMRKPWWSVLADRLFAPNGGPSFAAYGAVASFAAMGALLGVAAPIGASAEQEIALALAAGDGASPFGAIIR